MQQIHVQEHQAESPYVHVEALGADQQATEEVLPDTPLNQGQTESVEQLSAALTQEAQKARRTVLKFFGGVGVYGGLMIVGRFIVGSERWKDMLIPQMAVSAALSVGVVLSLLFVPYYSRPRYRRRVMTERVAEQDDVSTIGPLIDALDLGDYRTRNLAIGALIKRLPAMKTSDSSLLTARQSARLLRMLYVSAENTLNKDVRALFKPAARQAIALRVAILQALAEVGDAKAIPVVRHLATKEPKTEGEKEIHAAAVACLSWLEPRVEQTASSKTLLRASQAAAEGGDALLRAAENAADTPADELVRAVASNQ